MVRIDYIAAAAAVASLAAPQLLLLLTSNYPIHNSRKTLVFDEMSVKSMESMVKYLYFLGDKPDAIEGSQVNIVI